MDTILEYLPYVVIAIVFYNIGSHVRAVQMMLNLSKDPDRFIDMVQKIKEINSEVETSGMPEDAIPLEIERVNGYVYAYSKTTGEFLSQAHDIEQAIRIASQRFPGKTFWHPDFKKDSQTA